MTNEMSTPDHLLDQANASLKIIQSRPMPDIFSLNQQITTSLLVSRDRFTDPLLELLDIPDEKLPKKMSHRKLLDMKEMSAPAAKTVLETIMLQDLDPSISGLDLDWKTQVSVTMEDAANLMVNYRLGDRMLQYLKPELRDKIDPAKSGKTINKLYKELRIRIQSYVTKEGQPVDELDEDNVLPLVEDSIAFLVLSAYPGVEKMADLQTLYDDSLDVMDHLWNYRLGDVIAEMMIKDIQEKAPVPVPAKSESAELVPKADGKVSVFDKPTQEKAEPKKERIGNHGVVLTPALLDLDDNNLVRRRMVGEKPHIQYEKDLLELWNFAGDLVEKPEAAVLELRKKKIAMVKVIGLAYLSSNWVFLEKVLKQPGPLLLGTNDRKYSYTLNVLRTALEEKWGDQIIGDERARFGDTGVAVTNIKKLIEFFQYNPDHDFGLLKEITAAFPKYSVDNPEQRDTLILGLFLRKLLRDQGFQKEMKLMDLYKRFTK